MQVFSYPTDLKLVEILPDLSEDEDAANPDRIRRRSAEFIIPDNGGEPLQFALGQRGCTLLLVDGYGFVRNRRSGYKTYWICAKKVRTFSVCYNVTETHRH